MSIHKKISAGLISAVLVVSTFSVNVFADEAEPKISNQEETDQVIVTFKDGVKKQMDGLLSAASVKTLGNEEVAVLKVPKGDAIDAYIDELEKRDDIEHAEPDHLIDTAYTPNDPFYTYQYHHQNIEVEAAWDKTMGSSDVIVAVLDSGFDLSHPDLKNQIVYPASTSSTGMSVENHGTHVAGIIAGQIDNHQFGTGVAPKTSIMPVDVFYGEQAYSSDVITGIYYAVSQGADIINMSIGGYNYNYAYNNAIQYAHQNGVLVVAAAGNDYTDVPMYPASYNNVISVGSTDSFDQLSYFSNYGSYIDVVAPGSFIYSTLPYQSIGSMSGTSMATPVVAGVAALILATEPTLTNDEVAERIKSTAVDLGSSGVDYYYGHGLVNAKQALQIVEIPSPYVFEVYDDSTVVSGYLPFDVQGAKVIVRNHNGVIGELENYSGWHYFDVSIPKQNPGTILYVSVEDSKGNISEESVITVYDVTPPDAPTVNEVTDLSTSVTGSGEIGATISVRAGATRLGSTTVKADGSYTVSIPKQRGGTTLFVAATDSSGNVSEETSRTVIRVTAPDAPQVDKVTENTILVTGTAESGTEITIEAGNSVIGSATVKSDGTYSVTIPKQKVGTKLNITATDEAGNVSAITIVTVIDVTAPKAPTVNEVTDKSPTITGTAEVNALISVKSGNTILGEAKVVADGTYSVSIAKQKAGTKLSITATDVAGNVSSAKEVIILDVTAPIAPTVGKVTNQSASVSGTAEAAAQITVKAGKSVVGTSTVKADGTYSVSIPKQKAGTVLIVNATDKAGNISPAKEITVVDGTPPAISLKNKVTHHSTRVIGTAEADSKITVKAGTKSIGTATADAKGNYQVVIAKQKVGTKLSVTATDSVGNSSAPIAITVVDGNYPDLKVTHWALEEIMYLGDDQIIGGYPNGNFDPEKNTKRAEAAKMLVIALDLPVPSVSSAYKDVSNKHWAKDYIAAATKAGLFNGNPDGTFAPDKTLKRSEMAKIISVAYDFKAGGTNHFKDVKSGYWASGYISGLYENGITTGYSDKTFRAEKSTTRAEFSVFLARALNKEFR